MSVTIQISSSNFNNHNANIIFYADTGGTTNYGYYLIPTQIVTDYPYGVYELYFSADNRTCYSYVNNPNTNYLLQENNFTLDQEDNSKILIT